MKKRSCASDVSPSPCCPRLSGIRRISSPIATAAIRCSATAGRVRCDFVVPSQFCRAPQPSSLLGSLTLLLLIVHSCLQGAEALRCACDQRTTCGSRHFCHYLSGSSCVLEVRAATPTSAAAASAGANPFVATKRKCVQEEYTSALCSSPSATAGVRYSVDVAASTVTFCCTTAAFCNDHIWTAVVALSGNFSSLNAASSHLHVLKHFAPKQEQQHQQPELDDSTSDDDDSLTARHLGLVAALATLCTIVVLGTGVVVFCVFWRRRLRRSAAKANARRSAPRVLASMEVQPSTRDESCCPPTSSSSPHHSLSLPCSPASPPSAVAVDNALVGPLAYQLVTSTSSPGASMAGSLESVQAHSAMRQHLHSHPHITAAATTHGGHGNGTGGHGRSPVSTSPAHICNGTGGQRHTAIQSPARYHHPHAQHGNHHGGGYHGSSYPGSPSAASQSARKSMATAVHMPQLDFPPPYNEIDSPHKTRCVRLPPQYCYHSPPAALACELGSQSPPSSSSSAPLSQFQEPQIPPNRHIAEIPADEMAVGYACTVPQFLGSSNVRELHVPPNRHVSDAPDANNPLPWDCPGAMHHNAAVVAVSSTSPPPPNRTISDKV